MRLLRHYLQIKLSFDTLDVITFLETTSIISNYFNQSNYGHDSKQMQPLLTQ